MPATVSIVAVQIADDDRAARGHARPSSHARAIDSTAWEMIDRLGGLDVTGDRRSQAASEGGSAPEARRHADRGPSAERRSVRLGQPALRVVSDARLRDRCGGQPRGPPARRGLRLLRARLNRPARGRVSDHVGRHANAAVRPKDPSRGGPLGYDLDRRDGHSLDEDHVIIDIDGQWRVSGGTTSAGAHRMPRPSAAYVAKFNRIPHPEGL